MTEVAMLMYSWIEIHINHAMSNVESQFLLPFLVFPPPQFSSDKCSLEVPADRER
jgi:hypothetical protein